MSRKLQPHTDADKTTVAQGVPIPIDSSTETFFKFLRAVAITGIVYGHVNSDQYVLNTGFWSQHFLLLTSFLLGSCPVSLFLFLAGYLNMSSYRKSNALIFWKQNAASFGVHYLFWSIVYVLLNIVVRHETYSCSDLVWALLLGKACISLYYFIVLFQFILLTPLLFVWLQKRRLLWLPYIISFLYVVAYGCAYICYNAPFSMGVTPVTPFIPWLAVYWTGMLCHLYENEIHDWLCRRKNLLISLTIGAYVFCFGCIMYLWHVQGIHTSLVFRSLTIFTFIPINLLLFVLFLYRYRVIQNRLILLVGSYAYGIFLIHMVILEFIGKIPFCQTLQTFPVLYTLTVTITVIGCSILLTWLGQKILGRKRAARIGF